MITDLVQIQRLGEKKRAENLKFRRYLKSHVFVERQFRKAAEQVEDQIDCRQCGECCRVTEVQIAARDVEKLARFLGISEKAFVEKHTALDQAGAMPGLFLDHVLEEFGGGGVLAAQPVGEVAVDASVLLFERDGQREDLSLRQIFELFGHSRCKRSLLLTKMNHLALIGKFYFQHR